uniref:Uncharacterized protein n=1 Tax=Peronospora matthiolae TaxID=2874970 RepID=A0AAV1UTR2_9STRA
MTNGNTGDSSIGGKRKREIEVIVIDNDDDAEEDEPVIISPPGNQSAQQQADTCGSAAIRPKTSSTGTCALSQQNASANTDDQAASAHATMLEPFPFFEAPIHTSSSPYALPVHPSYSTPSISKGVNTVTPHANVGLQWGNSNFPFGMPPLVGNGHGSPVYTTNIMSPGATLSSAPASVGTPMWPTTSGISTDLASTLSLNNLHARRGAVSAQNVLVDSLVDRYHEVNQNVASMELQGEQLTRQIALAARQGPYTARPIMDLLNKLQPALEASKGLRDKLLIAMIVQSDDIMASVRSLRLSELGDVPQVPSISHRKCLQLSIEINRHKKKLVESNQQISDMLAKSYTVTSSMENSLIQSASAEIQVHERNIMRLKKARNVEFVRIVQFSNNIREALKQTFQQTVEAQRHQQQNYSNSSRFDGN